VLEKGKRCKSAAVPPTVLVTNSVKATGITREGTDSRMNLSQETCLVGSIDELRGKKGGEI
jgi:hypothetical protein